MLRQTVKYGKYAALLLFACASHGAPKDAPTSTDFVKQQLERRDEITRTLSDEQRKYYTAPFDSDASEAVAEERAERARTREDRSDAARPKDKGERPPRDRENDERKQRPPRDERYLR